MFDDDHYLQDVIKDIKESLNEGFHSANKYAATFKKYQVFYAENEALDLEMLRESEHGKRDT